MKTCGIRGFISMSDTKLVAIINITPDSFSDGGDMFSPLAALNAIERAVAAGATVIDVGAESTRPGAQSLAWEEEWNRLEPVAMHMAGAVKGRAEISVDTRHAATVREILPYGISWVNDVSGFLNPDMVEVVVASQCRLVVMHSLTVPANSAIVLPADVDVVAEVLAFGQRRIAELWAAGIARERIIFDPGVGFGKTAEQSVALLKDIDIFHRLGVPLLVGHSRKSFLKAWDATLDRDAATLEVSRYLVSQGVDYLRVHDVPAHAALRAQANRRVHDA